MGREAFERFALRAPRELLCVLCGRIVSTAALMRAHLARTHFSDARGDAVSQIAPCRRAFHSGRRGLDLDTDPAHLVDLAKRGKIGCWQRGEREAQIRGTKNAGKTQRST